VSVDRSFTPDAASIRAARRFVLAAAGDLAPDLLDAISVMVSELAMNAVQYARTTFVVSIELSADSLRVAVTDSGSGNPEAQPLPPASSPHGRGLFLVDRLADEWGVSPAADGPERTVWFRVATRSPQGLRSLSARSAQGMRS
jgi:anti-sigma regulatory factor (Ser/Thr protein kinase)